MKRKSFEQSCKSFSRKVRKENYILPSEENLSTSEGLGQCSSQLYPKVNHTACRNKSNMIIKYKSATNKRLYCSMKKLHTNVQITMYLHVWTWLDPCGIWYISKFWRGVSILTKTICVSYYGVCLPVAVHQISLIILCNITFLLLLFCYFFYCL